MLQAAIANTAFFKTKQNKTKQNKKKKKTLTHKHTYCLFIKAQIISFDSMSNTIFDHIHLDNFITLRKPLFSLIMSMLLLTRRYIETES